MSKSNQLLRKSYELKITVEGRKVEESPSLHRFSENDHIEIFISIDDGDDIENIYLHTDMLSAEWTMLPFGKNGNVFHIELSGLRGGRASWRFVAETPEVYLWEPSDYHQVLIDPALMNALAMYTLIPNISGRIEDWTVRLEGIKKMGFNAVHILPFTMMGASESPYSSADLFSIDPAYGDSTDDFRRFSEVACGMGITICLDIVLNHIGNDSKLCNEHADWVVPDSNRADGMKRAGCYHENNWISWEDLVLLNYQHPDPSVRKELFNYMLHYVLFWIEAAGGGNIILRLDNLHSSDNDFIKWLIPEIRKKYPEVIILSEFFGAEYRIEDVVIKYGLNIVTANSWEYPFAPSLQRYIESIHGRNGSARYLLSPVSHDTETAAELFGSVTSSIPRYAVCALMGTGITGIVQGFEYGIEKKINFIGRNEDNIESETEDFRLFISIVNHLLMSEEVLRMKGNVEFYDTGSDSLIVCRRRESGGGSILVAVNLDIYNEHNFDYHLTGEAEPLLCENTEVKHRVKEGLLSINIGACGACAVRTKR